LWSQNNLYWQIQNNLKKVNDESGKIAERVNSQLKDFNTNIGNLLQNDTKFLLKNDLYDFKLPSRNNFDYRLPNRPPEFRPPQINVDTEVRKDAKLFEMHNFQNNVQPSSYNFDYRLPNYNFNYRPLNYNFNYQLPQINIK
jgi:hypothetical protein